MTGWEAIRRAGVAELASLAQAWSDPQTAQPDCLAGILAATAGTAFAAEHHLVSGLDLEIWRSRVPIRDAAAFTPWIERIVAGEQNVLTHDPVMAFELTGGSSGGRRAVPYSAPLLDDFRSILLAWLGDLLTAFPAIASGTAYFAVSPVLQRPLDRLGPIPVGFDSDLGYFGAEIASHLAPLLVWHASLATTRETDWARASAFHLVAAADLSLISVWSPTFLIRLLDQIATDPDLPRLLSDGAYGLAGQPERAHALEQARNGGMNLRHLWPNLALVSAWSDAASNRPAQDLTARLGDVPFQPKGLLATEGVFTLPIAGLPFALPVLTASLLEFEDDRGNLWLADALREGETYDLIISTRGGLQRYRIGDRVIAMGPPDMPQGWQHPQPTKTLNMLRFAGRTSGSDLVGEKLTEAFVLTCLQGGPPSACLAPVSGPEARYNVWMDTADQPDQGMEYLTLLDGRLRHNPQYDYARRLGQLGAPQLQTCPDLLGRYTRHRLALGHRLSDIKPPVLLGAGPLHPDQWAGA